MSTDYSELRRRVERHDEPWTISRAQMLELLDEIERLRTEAARSKAISCVNAWSLRSAGLRDAQLAAALLNADSIRRFCLDHHRCGTDCGDGERIAQLAAALREIASYDEHYGGTMIEIARAALEGKEWELLI